MVFRRNVNGIVKWTSMFKQTLSEIQQITNKTYVFCPSHCGQYCPSCHSLLFTTKCLFRSVKAIQMENMEIFCAYFLLVQRLLSCKKKKKNESIMIFTRAKSWCGWNADWLSRGERTRRNTESHYSYAFKTVLKIFLFMITKTIETCFLFFICEITKRLRSYSQRSFCFHAKRLIWHQIFEKLWNNWKNVAATQPA